jgi:hypothetical protein
MYTYPRGLRAMLRKGVHRETDGLYFRGWRRGSPTGENDTDTEALANILHIEDFVSAKLGIGSDRWSRQCVGLAVQFGRDVLDLCAAADPMPVRVAITLDQGTKLYPTDDEGTVPSCTLRFYGVRPGVPEYYDEPSADDTQPFLLMSRVAS